MPQVRGPKAGARGELCPGRVMQTGGREIPIDGPREGERKRSKQKHM